MSRMPWGSLSISFNTNSRCNLPDPSRAVIDACGFTEPDQWDPAPDVSRLDAQKVPGGLDGFAKAQPDGMDTVLDGPAFP